MFPAEGDKKIKMKPSHHKNGSYFVNKGPFTYYVSHWGGGGTVGQQVCITPQGKKSNFGPKALSKEFSRPNMRQKCGNSPYGVH